MYILREHNYSMALNFKVPVVLKKEKNIFVIILWDSTSRSFSRLCSWELHNVIIKFWRSCVVLDYSAHRIVQGVVYSLLIEWMCMLGRWSGDY